MIGGNGHTEIDPRAQFRKRDAPMSWFGTTEARPPDYTARMKAAYGDQKAREITIDGTPHAMIFPNLFIAEIQMFEIQPLAVDDSVQHVTALQFKGRARHELASASSKPWAQFAPPDCRWRMIPENARALPPRRAGAQSRMDFLGRGEKRERRDELGFKTGPRHR